MAVYTVVTEDDARTLLRRLGLGALTSMNGIPAGIENTNYFVDCDSGRYVLTVFERLSAEQLPYYLWLMRHLAGHGIPVPDPRADAQGELLFEVQGKPAALLTRLPGSHRMAPDLRQIGQLGTLLARMHLAGLDFAHKQPHLRGLAWWAEVVPVVRPHVDAGQSRLLDEELAYQQTVAASPVAQGLPQGPIHADLFRDNALFDGAPGEDHLSGVLDFFFAGHDSLLFDIAVCLNDWCADLDSGRLDEARAQVFFDAYDAERRLSAAEMMLMPALLRGAAFRFWLSRLWDLHLPRDAEELTAHDPAHFERVLRERIATPWHPQR